MKTPIIVILFYAGLFLNSHAQSIYLEDDSITTTGDATFSIEIKNHVINNTSDSVDLRWVRIVEDFPAGWDVPFCDNNVCYVATTDSAVFTLAPGDTGLLKPIFYTDEIEGIGTFSIRLYSLTPAVSFDDTVSFKAIAVLASGINALEEVPVEISPTVTSGTVRVTASKVQPDYYSVIASDGKTVSGAMPLLWQSESAEINFSSLTTGVYFILFHSKEKSIIASTQIVKM